MEILILLLMIKIALALVTIISLLITRILIKRIRKTITTPRIIPTTTTIIISSLK